MFDEAVKQYLLAKPEAVEEYPFGPDAMVVKVQQKMFALCMVRNGQQAVNLKCDPDEAQQLRDIFSAVSAGYHMNKRHWNTVLLDGSLPPSEIERMIDNSYSLVVKGLKKADREGLEARHGRQRIYAPSN
ncbi:MmcQ/YjbR family DNA-binding protein [Marinomonas pollencensis]|uniref:Putative DNA-binding protein (MmcQ/YjbR family) n=1 Tax=Marinomonas pollencensis TaxID=491954 RepID=A0A3E0DK75_9GAMM|nr:MmcQ/YjbR family DNA-binding protein [Marinomonas pollencensis]REG82189.1 putative DNA-binding protein (MmcQ/YjbR family) [Marinomonas pollencensis]